MSFNVRLGAARELETKVIAGLESRGWFAWAFGQEQIPEQGRDILRRYKDDAHRPSLIRWMPDILALRETHRPQVALIDAKGGDGPRYAIETRSLEAAEIFVGRLHTPVFFVCRGGGVLTPRDIRERGWPGPESTKGSGTPYLLVDKRWAQKFDAVFGTPETAERAA